MKIITNVTILLIDTNGENCTTREVLVFATEHKTMLPPLIEVFLLSSLTKYYNFWNSEIKKLKRKFQGYTLNTEVGHLKFTTIRSLNFDIILKWVLMESTLVV